MRNRYLSKKSWPIFAIIGALFIAMTPSAMSATNGTKMPVKICADLKSGKARVVALKIKCQKTEITVTIPMAVEAKEGAAGKSILHGTT
ncbi:MAG: hypothetical protein F2814_06005, partial [Actinobacteria bacterium]|nr:hypothetical protein [Actinomycetota bacterium]